jgi:hypothetical protein
VRKEEDGEMAARRIRDPLDANLPRVQPGLSASGFAGSPERHESLERQCDAKDPSKPAARTDQCRSCHQDSKTMPWPHSVHAQAGLACVLPNFTVLNVFQIMLAANNNANNGSVWFGNIARRNDTQAVIGALDGDIG